MKRFLKEERGMETVEWAVLAALIVAGLITVVVGIGNNVKSAFTKLQDGTKP
jgi:Flp pilus assembly pilin Flp